MKTIDEEIVRALVHRSWFMSDDFERTGCEGLEAVISGSVNISALLTGFMLVFLGLVLGDSKDPSWIQLACLFCTTALLEFFYRAMVRGWNLLAVRAMAETGDRILDGTIKDGPDYAAFRALWGFQPKLYQGSWFILVVVTLYGTTKSLWNIPALILGFLGGLVLYIVIGEWGWLKTWRRCSAWDKSIYLGQPLSPELLPLHQRLFLRMFSARGQPPHKSSGGFNNEMGGRPPQ